MGKIFSRHAPDAYEQPAFGMTGLVMGMLAITIGIVAWGIMREEPQVAPIAEPMPKAHMRIEIVNTPEARRIGLSKYQSISYDQGMAFEFDAASRICVWNKDVAFPVSVAFLGEDGKILNIEDMRARSTHHVCSAGPSKYAIETRTDWMNDHWRKPKGK